MTLQEALELLQCNSSELSRMLGITTAAVAQWDKQKIPLGREYQVLQIAQRLQNQSEPYCTPESVIRELS